MKNIGLDVSALSPDFKSHAHRGIGRYVFELSRYFMRNGTEDLQVGFFDHKELIGRGAVSSLIDRLPYGRNTIKQQIFYPFTLKGPVTGGYDVLHFPAHMDAPAWSPKKYVLTLLDLIPLVLPDLYKADRLGWRFKFARWLEITAIKNADYILAISEATAKDAHKVLGIPYERIRVTPLGVDKKFFRVEPVEDERSLRERYGIPQNSQVVLYLGGIDPRKNINGLIGTFSILLQICRERNTSYPVLVIAGNIKEDREYPKLLKLIEDNGLEESVSLPGYIPDEDLIRILSVAEAFFFPSLYEGFGLPVLEALASGVPVVSSNRSSMPEVLGDAGVLVDPLDYRRCAEELYSVLTDKERASALKDIGIKRARQFTWDKTGELTRIAYNEIFSERI